MVRLDGQEEMGSFVVAIAFFFPPVISFIQSAAWSSCVYVSNMKNDMCV